ncbi:MAG: hypothetical protein ABMA26_16120 [Limisphaerales bacterium]
MEVPVQIVAAGFAAILVFLGWIVRMLYRIAGRVQRIEGALDHHGLKLPTLTEL